ncbi:MAG: hypothetical protein AAF633_23835 [Chloroflexota bacterium]
MNYKETISEIVVLNSPESFQAEIDGLPEGATIHREADTPEKINYGVGFAITKAELDAVSTALTAKVEGDALLWIAYPKKSSKKYTCEFNRDTGWEILGAAGFEPVRMVAIDADWSALRFRKVDYIKNLKRRSSMAISEKGKARTN